MRLLLGIRRFIGDHVIPAKAGIQLAEVGPRVRGGDRALASISLAGRRTRRARKNNRQEGLR